MKSVLNCIYCFLNNSCHKSLMLFPNLKIKKSLKYILLNVKSWYKLVSILSTYDYNSIRCLVIHSMDLELEDRGKKILLPIFLIQLRKNKLHDISLKNQNNSKYFPLFFLKYIFVPSVDCLCSILWLFITDPKPWYESSSSFYHFIKK